MLCCYLVSMICLSGPNYNIILPRFQWVFFQRICLIQPTTPSFYTSLRTGMSLVERRLSGSPDNFCIWKASESTCNHGGFVGISARASVPYLVLSCDCWHCRRYNNNHNSVIYIAYNDSVSILLGVHMTAEDTQLYVPFTSDEAVIAVARVEDCAAEINLQRIYKIRDSLMERVFVWLLLSLVIYTPCFQ